MFSISKILETNNSAAANSCDEESNNGQHSSLAYPSDDAQIESDEENDHDSSNQFKMDKSVGGKRSRGGRETRTRFSKEQINILNEKLALNPYPKDAEIARIADEMGLKDRVVSVWFQNHRHSTKKRRTFGTNGLVNSSADSSPAQSVNQTNLEARTAHAKENLPPAPVMTRTEPAAASNWSSLLASNNLNINPNILASFMSPTPPISPAQNGALPFNMNLLLASMNPQQQSALFYFLMSRMSMNAQSQIPPQQDQQKQQPVNDQQTQPESKKPVKGAAKQPQPSNVVSSQAQKKSRSRMDKQSYNILRLIFAECRLPSQSECELLGDLLDMNKKVVQTWFQNNRAKEKKHNGVTVIDNKPVILMSSNSGVDDLTSFEFCAESCILCGGYKYEESEGSSRRAHLFSAEHVHRLGEFLEEHVAGQSTNPAANTTTTSSSGSPQTDDYVLHQSDYLD